MTASLAPLGGLLAVILRIPIFLKGVYTMIIVVCKANELRKKLQEVWNVRLH